jgi:predicted dehydrogenase
MWYRDEDYFSVPWRGTWEVEGGGPTMGHGIHQFDLLLSILGRWNEVSAFAARQVRPTATEDLSCALVRFDSGALATVVNSVLSARQESSIRIDFEFASVELTHLYGYRDADWTFTPAPGHAELAELWEGVDMPSGHTAQLRAIYQAHDNDQAPPVSPSDARPTMELIAAIYASAFTGQIVRSGELRCGSPFAKRMGGGRVPWERAV